MNVILAALLLFMVTWGSAQETMAGSASNFSIGVTLDGGDDVNNDAQTAFEPPVDSVGQMRVLANAYDASIRRSLGAKLDVTSKSSSRV